MTRPSAAEPPPADSAILAAENLSKSFRVGKRRIDALDGVSFTAEAGGITGLIGPDGAGKTTLMRLAAGLLLPDTGRLSVLGLDAAEEPLAVQSRVGYMPQRFGLYEDLTVQENLDLYADLQGVPSDERPPRYTELMHMTGLAAFTGRLAGRLSGGMKQKLGLACTLVRAPELLLLDEPTVGVDPVSRRELWAIVDRLVGEGMSVLLSTAYLDEAERCDEVVLLHEGGALGHGPPEQFAGALHGRSFTLHGGGLKPRQLQPRAAVLPGVVDAVVQGEQVRIVMAESGEPELAGGPFAGVRPEPVAPRLEDAFVALLHGRRPPSPPPEVASQRAADAVPDPVIVVRELERRFGEFRAVKGISFEVRRGEVFGLLGANGAGKSTTFRMLCGLLPASGGSLSVAGVDLRHAAAQARRRIGYMSQRFSLYGNLSARQNLHFFASAYGLYGRRRAERIAWSLAQFELESLADAPSADLPLGYKQRLAMAAALLHQPDILFLDEPTSGVDPLARREFWHRINALAEAGVTVMVTTHFMEEAEYCDRIAILAAGSLLALGTPAEIKARARTPQLPEPTMEEAFIALIQDGGGA